MYENIHVMHVEYESESYQETVSAETLLTMSSSFSVFLLK